MEQKLNVIKHLHFLPAALAKLVELLTDDPEFKGLNPVACTIKVLG
jgi:hypothetical protein